MRLQERWDVLNDEIRRARSDDRFRICPPEDIARVADVAFAQCGESLAGGTPEDHIGVEFGGVLQPLLDGLCEGLNWRELIVNSLVTASLPRRILIGCGTSPVLLRGRLMHPWSRVGRA